MNINEEYQDSPQEYLAALIEIYRGKMAQAPVLDKKTENDLMRDVLSSAISFTKSDESRQKISAEIFLCSQGKCNFQQQIESAKKDTPELLNAKMTAAAYVMKLLLAKN